MNLIRDFKRILLNHGRKQGLIFSDVDSDKTFIRILSFNRKIGLGNKKKVSYAKGIRIPKKYKKRVSHILEYLADGGNIIPYLSKQSINLNNPGDLMFNDWNILHIHLGKRKDKRDSRFIERTGELLFLINTDKEIRVLGVYDHKPSPWTKKELLQRIYDTWPEMLGIIEGAELNISVTEVQKRTLRKSHITVFDEVYDKKTRRKLLVHVKNALGLVCSGESTADVRKYNDIIRALRHMEMNLKKQEQNAVFRLDESNGVWIVIDQNLRQLYGPVKLVKLNKVHKL